MIAIYHHVSFPASFLCKPPMSLIQQSRLWVSNCELLSEGRRSSVCGVCKPPSSFPTALLFLCMIKEGRRSRLLCPRQQPAHLSRIIRPPGFLSCTQDRRTPVHLWELGVQRRPARLAPWLACLMSVWCEAKPLLV